MVTEGCSTCSPTTSTLITLRAIPVFPTFTSCQPSPWLVGVDKALAAEVGVEMLTSNRVRPTPDPLGQTGRDARHDARRLAVLQRTMERVRERLNPELSLVGSVPLPGRPPDQSLGYNGDADLLAQSLDATAPARGLSDPSDGRPPAQTPGSLQSRLKAL
jgi:hypothetical protein